MKLKLEYTPLNVLYKKMEEIFLLSPLVIRLCLNSSHYSLFPFFLLFFRKFQVTDKATIKNDFLLGLKKFYSSNLDRANPRVRTLG